MSLASIETQLEHEQMKSVVNQDTKYWLGGTDIFEDGVWTWLYNVKSIDMRGPNSFWLSGEPNNVGDNEHCLQLNHRSRYQFNDKNCKFKYGVVCHYET